MGFSNNIFTTFCQQQENNSRRFLLGAMAETKPRVFVSYLQVESPANALSPVMENILLEEFDLVSIQSLERNPELWDSVQGAVTRLPWEPEQTTLLEKARNLKIVCSLGVGTDHLDLDHWKGRGVAVGYTPTAVSEATADTAFALLLSAVCGIKRGTVIFSPISNKIR